MNIKIAISDSYKYKIKNKEYTYEEFKKYLLGFEPISISFKNEDNKEFEEALKECMKNHKEKIKGFVGGQFSKNNSERIDENLSYRSLIVLDADEYDKGLECLEQSICEELGRYKYLAYSTIGHTPEKPKIRIILFPNKDIEKTEYKEISSNFIAKLSFKDAIDDASTKPNQFMLISVKPEFNGLPEGLNYPYAPWCMDNENGELLDIKEYMTENMNYDNSSLDSDFLEDEDFLKDCNNTPLDLTDEQVLEYLKFCEPKSAHYHTWLKVGQVLHHQYQGSEIGKKMWKDWSETYKKSEDNIDQIDIKWKSFSQNKDSPMTMRSIIKLYNKKNNLQIQSIEDLKNEIKQDQENNQDQPLDIHKYRHRIYEIKKSIIKNDPAVDNKSLNLKNLNNITTNIKIYNDLLTINYEDDKPYSWGKYIQEIRSNPVGLQTGFRALDQHVTIQPASLVFIAGRPSHGKTTMMLNMLRNMIKANPNKSFLFYSYEEEKKAILSKIVLANINLSNNEELIIDKEAEQYNNKDNYRNRSYLEKLQIHLGKYDGTYYPNTKNDSSIITMTEIVYQAKKEVEEWINDGRLQILDRKPNVEILSSAIMERVSASEKEKPIVAIFIDYVQMLSTETERPTRQQELQKICSTLLDTSQDKRVKAAIILGAQVNREVKSSDGFNLHNMKDAGDIEQIANLVLGVWNPLAEQMQMLQGAIDIAEMKIKLNDTFNKSEEYGDLSALLFDKIIPDTDINKLQNVIYRAKQKIKSIAKQKEQKLTIKILKNRNGLKDLDITLNTCLSRFLIIDENNNTYTQQKIQELLTNTK